MANIFAVGNGGRLKEPGPYQFQPGETVRLKAHNKLGLVLTQREFVHHGNALYNFYHVLVQGRNEMQVLEIPESCMVKDNQSSPTPPFPEY